MLAANVGENVDTPDELHRQKVLFTLFDQIAEAHQIRVAHVLKRAEFLPEASNPFGVVRAEYLECDVLFGRVIEGREHPAHAAFAETLADSKPGRRDLRRRRRPPRHLLGITHDSSV